MLRDAAGFSLDLKNICEREGGREGGGSEGDFHCCNFERSDKTMENAHKRKSNKIN